MNSRGGRIFIVAALISVLLSSGAQAAGFFALDGNPAEREIGLFEQVIRWLSGAWGDLTSAFGFSEQTPPPPTGTECTQDCGDAGPGIDPIG